MNFGSEINTIICKYNQGSFWIGFSSDHDSFFVVLKFLRDEVGSFENDANKTAAARKSLPLTKAKGNYSTLKIMRLKTGD